MGSALACGWAAASVGLRLLCRSEPAPLPSFSSAAHLAARQGALGIGWCPLCRLLHCLATGLGGLRHRFLPQALVLLSH